ncbi:hypothetical protein OF001_U650002 [Pseudomonas sp. OF001]|nr:hypothetical protein OF001_U650002 [Pseudomonas sp. OF001]
MLAFSEILKMAEVLLAAKSGGSYHASQVSITIPSRRSRYFFCSYC